MLHLLLILSLLLALLTRELHAFSMTPVQLRQSQLTQSTSQRFDRFSGAYLSSARKLHASTSLAVSPRDSASSNDKSPSINSKAVVAAVVGIAALVLLYTFSKGI